MFFSFTFVISISSTTYTQFTETLFSAAQSSATKQVLSNSGLSDPVNAHDWLSAGLAD